MKRVEINEVVNPQGIYSLKKIELPSYLMNMPESMREAVYGIEKIEDDIIFLEMKEVENNLFIFPMIGKVGVDMETFRKYWDELVEEVPEKSNASFYFHAKGNRKDSDGYYEWRTNGRRTYVKFYPVDATYKGECYKSRSTCHKADLKDFNVEVGVELACNRAKMKYIKEKINKLENNTSDNKTLKEDTKTNYTVPVKETIQDITKKIINGKDLSNMQFTDLKVKGFTGRQDNSRHNLWECECKCGKTIIVSSSDLLRCRKTCCPDCKNKKESEKSFAIGDKVVYRSHVATIIDMLSSRKENSPFAIIKYEYSPTVEAVPLKALLPYEEKEERQNIW